MQISWKGRRAGLGSAAVLMGLAAAALAGPRYGDPGVTIVRNADGSGEAYGTLGGTRNSASPLERLACTVTRTEADPASPNPARATVVTCAARDKNNVSVTCSSPNDAVADGITGLASDGLLDFRWDSNGICTSVSVYESSSLERKR